jgi:hypothetical protein
MCFPRLKFVVFPVLIACLCACGPIDALLPSTGTYKVNANINDVTLDELSFIDSNDSIHPFFEEPVSNDPDVTALVVYLRNSRGNTAGWKVSYTLDRVINEKKDESADVSPDEKLTGDELTFSVKSLDGELPVFPLPDDLPPGLYTLVSHVMSGKDTLQRIEKSIYYMGKTAFSYDGINVYLPGISENSHVVPKGMVVMLETALDFDSRLNPYIIWYNGRRKISEGFFSDGFGHLLWKAPEQSGFFSLRAEVFPVENYGLSGYQKEVTLLVSSKSIDVNLVSENIPQLLHWYTFEGGMNDSKMISSPEQALKPNTRNNPIWAGANGTYGLVTGSQDIFSIPKVTILNNGNETWQILFRFKPLNDGIILCVQFGNSRDILMCLKKEGQNLVLELVSSSETASVIYALPEQDSFIKAGITFSVLPKMLSANLNIMGDYIYKNEFDGERAAIGAEIEGGFQILLGYAPEGAGGPEAARKRDTAIWDEFALYFMPPDEIFGAYIIAAADVQQPQDNAFLAN